MFVLQCHALFLPGLLRCCGVGKGIRKHTHTEFQHLVALFSCHRTSTRLVDTFLKAKQDVEQICLFVREYERCLPDALGSVKCFFMTSEIL